MKFKNKLKNPRCAPVVDTFLDTGLKSNIKLSNILERFANQRRSNFQYSLETELPKLTKPIS
jgi:SPX domain protein involved in polyphosphate accumulation